MCKLDTCAARTTYWLVWREPNGTERSNAWYSEASRDRFVAKANVTVIASGTGSAR